jgi:UDP-N-acetylmuramoyl-tripeptide--D-alanyl-D-alanine ligase
LKKIQLKIEDLFYLPTSVIYSPDDLKTIVYVTIDSKSVKKNSLFIAIKGKRFDGHEFVKDVVRKGVTALVIDEKKLKNFDDVDLPIITVKNTTKALGNIARIWRRKLSAKVIGITGSSGKTTVKDMIASLLSEKYSVSKTEFNNNNHIGVPLTILNTNNTHDVLVAELGTNHFGEIPYTANILSPDYALITNIGDSHLEFLKNKKGIWKEKSSLFDATINNGGKIFINNNDPFTSTYKAGNRSKITFGFVKRGDINGKIKSFTADGRSLIELKKKNESFEFVSPVNIMQKICSLPLLFLLKLD